MLHIGDYYAANGAEEWAKEHALSNASAHAGFMDAAEMMAIHPEGVRPALIKHYAEKDFGTEGVLGDPSGATAEFGKKLLDFKVQAAVAQITKSRQNNPK